MSFSERSAKTAVVGAVAGAALLSSAQSLATGTMPPVRIGVGAVIAGAMLYALADSAPAVAGGFALLLITGAVMVNGVQVAKIVTHATTGK